MKVLKCLCVALILILNGSCKKKTDSADAEAPVVPAKTYSSAAQFLKSLAPSVQSYPINISTGGSFTTAQGTKVTLSSNSLLDKNGNVVVGNVQVEFLDLYRRSDMLFANMPTITSTKRLLKSAGEFFIRVKQNNEVLQIKAGNIVKVERPANGEPIDFNMSAFTGVSDTAVNSITWVANTDTIPNSGGSVAFTQNSYIFNLSQFNAPLANGSWCNWDNAYLFNTYTQTPMTMTATDNVSDYGTNLYLIFSSVNTVIRVYNFGNNPFIYQYAPTGLNCTLVAIGYKDGKLYSALKPIAIANNTNVSFTLSETTDQAFKDAVNALN